MRQVICDRCKNPLPEGKLPIVLGARRNTRDTRSYFWYGEWDLCEGCYAGAQKYFSAPPSEHQNPSK